MKWGFMKKEKYGWQIVFNLKNYFNQRTWNWFLIPSVEFEGWHDSKFVKKITGSSYKSMYLISQFLKLEFSVGLVYNERPPHITQQTKASHQKTTTSICRNVVGKFFFNNYRR